MRVIKGSHFLINTWLILKESFLRPGIPTTIVKPAGLINVTWVHPYYKHGDQKRADELYVALMLAADNCELREVIHALIELPEWPLKLLADHFASGTCKTDTFHETFWKMAASAPDEITGINSVGDVVTRKPGKEIGTEGESK